MTTQSSVDDPATKTASESEDVRGASDLGPDTSAPPPAPAPEGQAGQEKEQAATTTTGGEKETTTQPTTAVAGAGTDEGATDTRGGETGKGAKGFFSGIHGAGEVLRGNLMQSVDEIFGHQEGVEKHKKVAEAGMEQVRSARGQPGGATGEEGTSS